MTGQESRELSLSRVLLDLTTSYKWRGSKAVGISRTEREIGLRLLEDPSLDVVPFRFQDDKLLKLPPQETRDLLHGKAPPPPTKLAARRWHLGKLILHLLPLAARPLAAAGLTHLRDRLLRAGRRRAATGGDFVIPSGSDVLFTCGAGWEYLDWRAITALKRRTGLRLVAVCYDIIPVIFPVWDPAPSNYFNRYFLNLVDKAESLICISLATQRDVLTFSARHGRPLPTTHVVHLGADLPEIADPGALPDSLRARFSQGRFALTVGTFEVRKNHALLLDIWERLTQDPSFDLDLVIAGRRGWMADDVIGRLENSPLFGNRIFWFIDADDPALSWLYETCRVVLFPSLYEGWGLPVVEALQHLTPVIASNRGAVPEAGFGVASIIDPDDHVAWVEAVARCAREARTKVLPVTLPNWDTTESSIAAILRPFTRTMQVIPQADKDVNVPYVPAYRHRGKALFIDQKIPTPDQDSGSADIVCTMKILIDLGFAVSFLAAGDRKDAGHYTSELQQIGIDCVAFTEVSPDSWLRHNAKHFKVALLYRVGIAARFAGLLRRANPALKLIFNTVDLHFIREEREAALHRDSAALRQAQATRKLELQVIAKVDATIVLSNTEQETIARLMPQTLVWLVPIMREVPGSLGPLEERRDVLFVGGFAHAPNVDAMLHFTASVWPLVRERLPGIRLFIVGSHPTAEVRSLQNPSAGIMVSGHVPDLEDMLSGCRLSVAPLRYGAGIKGKVVTSLAHGLPCVATSVAAEGMGLTNGTEILVADTPGDIAAAIERIYLDDALWQRLSSAGTVFAEQHFSVNQVQVRLDTLLASLGV